MIDRGTSTEGNEAASQRRADNQSVGERPGERLSPHKRVSMWGTEHQAHQKRFGVGPDNP